MFLSFWLIFSLCPPTMCSGWFGRRLRACFGQIVNVSVYIHLFAQRYPACVRPTGVARLSIVEVNKNPSLTKREQTAAVCSGFPNKHSTRRATDGGERQRERDRGAVRTWLFLYNTRSNRLLSHSSGCAPEAGCWFHSTHKTQWWKEVFSSK